MGNRQKRDGAYARSDKIFLLFPLPVKVTRRGDNQERQGEMTTRSDKKARRRFF
jgi:hypothetical protein